MEPTLTEEAVMRDTSPAARWCRERALEHRVPGRIVWHYGSKYVRTGLVVMSATTFPVHDEERGACPRCGQLRGTGTMLDCGDGVPPIVKAECQWNPSAPASPELRAIWREFASRYLCPACAAWLKRGTIRGRRMQMDDEMAGAA